MSESVKFKVTHGKALHPIELSPSLSLYDLKLYLQELTGVPANLQKLFLKGPLKDDSILLSSLNLRESTKIMLVGSTTEEITQTSNIRIGFEEEKKIDFSRDGFSADQQRIIDKGPCSDSIAPDLLANLDVPDTITGLYNHLGANIRLTIKKEIDEVWIVNNTNTRKVPFAVIRSITYIPIIKYPGYNVLTFDLGPSNKYNVYFFPVQFIRSLKTLICPFYVEGLDLSQFK